MPFLNMISVAWNLDLTPFFRHENCEQKVPLMNLNAAVIPVSDLTSEEVE